jgi:glycosyltransferase involved in cell wall biosynthesis
MKTLAVIPAYNEAPRIGGVVRRVRRIIDDVLVVDDASTDNGPAVAADAGALVLHNEPPNHGKGYALRVGFSYALAEDYGAVVTLDADGQHPPELIPRFLAALEDGADLVYGNRLGDLTAMPPERVFSNRTTTALVSLLAGTRLADSQCGMRAVRAWVLRTAVTECDGFAAESEQLILAARNGARLAPVTIPTIYLPDSSSKMHVLRDTLRFARRWFRWLGWLW